MTGHKVIIAIGTNTDHQSNMDKAIGQLRRIMTDMRCSRALWTEPIGMKTDRRFLNSLVAGTCPLGPDSLRAETKRVEQECGRTDSDRDSGIVRMDIDILEYDHRREHPADWQRDYIRQLIKEIL